SATTTATRALDGLRGFRDIAHPPRRASTSSRPHNPNLKAAIVSTNSVERKTTLHVFQGIPIILSRAGTGILVEKAEGGLDDVVLVLAAVVGAVIAFLLIAHLNR